MKKKIKDTYKKLFKEKKLKFQRSLSFGDYFTDRWERAKLEGFGKGTSVYDNVLILGKVKVGKNCWIGPNCILDGKGGLEIGDNCIISAGVHIYSHFFTNNKKTLSKTVIKNNVYIGPNSIISLGCVIGNNTIIGALSFVDENIGSNTKFFNKVLKVKKKIKKLSK